MVKPDIGTYLIRITSETLIFEVIDIEPKNWKGRVEVRQVLPGGGYGPSTLFDEADISQYVTFEQIKHYLLVGRKPQQLAAA